MNMKNTTSLTLSRIPAKSLAIDLLALAFIYFTPALSHLLALPVYFVEPMRLMLILAMAHTSRRNAFVIAATLPLFSFIVSAHPNLFKMMLITGELTLNVWLFYFLMKRTGNAFVSMITGIVLSKAAYYVAKFGLLSLVVLQGSLVSTPLIIQLITTLVFSGYVFLFWRRKQSA